MEEKGAERESFEEIDARLAPQQGYQPVTVILRVHAVPAQRAGPASRVQVEEVP